MNTSSEKLRNMIIVALFAGIIGILAQITIPLPLVPITGQTLAVGLAATILGSRNGTAAVILYIMIGAVGVPVFSQMSAGLGILFGPTGGFIVGFIPAAYLIGFYLEKTRFTLTNAIISNLIGMVVTLLFGTMWLKIVASLNWTEAFISGFGSFVIVGIIKSLMAASIGIVVRNRLKATRLLVSPAGK